VTTDLAYATGVLGVTELLDIVQWIAADEGIWVDRVQTPGSDRWWTRLYVDEAVDVWLLTWLPGQFTDLHDHGPSTAVFTVIRGELEEMRLGRDADMQITSCAPGSRSVVEAGVVHDVRAVGTDLAVSIHAYSPPLTLMTYYTRNDDGDLHIARQAETDEPEQQLAR
jgi:predicted metal-dependent enzyme (double-stranded beta helix superfamily)